MRDLKIANTDFDLLRAIGGECAGALSILQVEHHPQSEQEYYELSTEEVTKLVTRRGQVYTWRDNERPRLSLAGAQNKCPVLVKNNSYWMPRGYAPTSHILKFEISNYRHLPAYETFTTQLAKAIGLPVVDIQLCSIEKMRYAQIQRYDRYRLNNGNIARLHQEDFCQALGYGHERKYQEDGGPTFADCYHLVRNVSTNPAHDLQNLLDWQIFNVLVGNSDGHAKNLSFLYQANDDIRLAPFYDLICTRAIERIDENLAFSVGGERNPSLITPTHWSALAQECGIRPRFVLEQVKNMTTQLSEQLLATKNYFETTYGEYSALQRIEHVVTKHCRRALSE